MTKHTKPCPRCKFCNRKTRRKVKLGYCTFFTVACKACHP